MQILRSIRVAGWKSIKDQTLVFTPLTVVIGANGAGKSNLLSLFDLLDDLFDASLGFRRYVGMNGYADSLLHYGSGQTPVAELELAFETRAGEIVYYAKWGAGIGGSLIFSEERVTFVRTDSAKPTVIELGAGHSESHLLRAAEDGGETATALQLLRSCRQFHFHDTSENSAARMPSLIEANRFLYSNAGNLASMLYLFREQYPVAFKRIRATVRQMVPDFDGFILEPSALNRNYVSLKWAHKGRKYEFGPHQLSDGSLRFIALATLLLQPVEKLPMLIALDEPELGLHPAALEVLAGMAKATALQSQVILATQSSVFLDHFEPEDVVVVDTRCNASEFRRLDAKALEAWRADYTLGEIWEKNVVGGGPYG